MIMGQPRLVSGSGRWVPSQPRCSGPETLPRDGNLVSWFWSARITSTREPGRGRPMETRSCKTVREQGSPHPHEYRARTLRLTTMSRRMTATAATRRPAARCPIAGASAWPIPERPLRPPPAPDTYPVPVPTTRPVLPLSWRPALALSRCETGSLRCSRRIGGKPKGPHPLKGRFRTSGTGAAAAWPDPGNCPVFPS